MALRGTGRHTGLVIRAAISKVPANTKGGITFMAERGRTTATKGLGQSLGSAMPFAFIP